MGAFILYQLFVGPLNTGNKKPVFISIKSHFSYSPIKAFGKTKIFTAFLLFPAWKERENARSYLGT